MAMLKLQFFILGLFILFCYGCSNNSIYYDIKRNKICSKGGYVLMTVVLDDEEGASIIFINEKNKSGESCIGLNGYNKDYEITTYGNIGFVKDDSLIFNFKPNKRYKVTSVSNSDLERACIYLITDNNSRVTKVESGITPPR